MSAAAVLDEVPDLPVRGLPSGPGGRHAAGSGTLDELRQRVHRMQGGPSGRRLPGLVPDLDLATGAAYATDSAGLALALLAGPGAVGGVRRPGRQVEVGDQPGQPPGPAP
ncbi:MAG: hypothetical protein EOP01_06120, partial [Propionibacteriaceae bacterium]